MYETTSIAEIISIVTVAIIFAVLVLLLCIALSSPFHREIINLPQRQSVRRTKSKKVSTKDYPPNYEDAILNPPDYSPCESCV